MLQLMLLAVLRSLWLVIISWTQLVHTLINWHKNMCWRLVLWMINITTFPVRAVFALQREKMMKTLLQEMQYQLDDLEWDNKELQAHLQMSMKEQHFLKTMLSELEVDHDKAILKIEFQEREVRRLKGENLRLREVRSKGHWDSMGKSDVEDEPSTDIPWQSNKDGELWDRDSWSNEKPLSTGLNPTRLIDPLTPLVFSSRVDTDVALAQRREVAFSQSLFSVIFSLLVGLIIWAAEDPCFPLVMALFTVVGLSLRSVVQLFSTIKNRPASEAVALLSFNWFILGTLACPTFPYIARFLSPIVGAFFNRILVMY